ncbi:MAG TPA: NAD(P)-binding domain-containing protein [Jatrophihabitantaceae bacterium]|jgi:putative flavoprotein involved in K+ transport
MNTTGTVVIGAGHAGLAVSRLLTAAGRDHVVLERGRVAQRWRAERWDSLHLLTPNWMTRLPGHPYAGPEPDAFMPACRFVDHLEHYAASFAAPVLTGTTVLAVTATAAGDYRVATDRGTWSTRSVVIATGPHGVPRTPAGIDADVLTAAGYRKPAQLPSGGVLIIGASSSGVQIADELNRAGRDVVLAVGRHRRLPRSYRGRDIFWWLDRAGHLARTIDTFADAARARHEPSLQLIGRNQPIDDGVDLAALQARGVRLAGRVDGMLGGRARFRDDLADSTAEADRVMHRVLDGFDARVTGLDGTPVARPEPVRPNPLIRELDLARAGIATVLVATGYRPHHPWLRLPITGPGGVIRQHRGVTSAPGVYVVGQRFQHRRDSGFIAGARHDARAVVHHLLRGASPRALARVDEEAAA